MGVGWYGESRRGDQGLDTDYAGDWTGVRTLRLSPRALPWTWPRRQRLAATHGRVPRRALGPGGTGQLAGRAQVPGEEVAHSPSAPTGAVRRGLPARRRLAARSSGTWRRGKSGDDPPRLSWDVCLGVQPRRAAPGNRLCHGRCGLRHLRLPPAHVRPRRVVTAAAFSPDGRRLAFSSPQENLVRLWRRR